MGMLCWWWPGSSRCQENPHSFYIVVVRSAASKELPAIPHQLVHNVLQLPIRIFKKSFREKPLWDSQSSKASNSFSCLFLWAFRQVSLQPDIFQCASWLVSHLHDSAEPSHGKIPNPTTKIQTTTTRENLGPSPGKPHVASKSRRCWWRFEGGRMDCALTHGREIALSPRPCWVESPRREKSNC